MKYIIDEEDLKDIFNGEKPRFDVFESVEKIASGKNTSTFLVIASINNSRVIIDKSYTGKNIEIYIKEL